MSAQQTSTDFFRLMELGRFQNAYALLSSSAQERVQNPEEFAARCKAWMREGNRRQWMSKAQATPIYIGELSSSFMLNGGPQRVVKIELEKETSWRISSFGDLF